MAVVTLGSALAAIRGRVGDVVFKTYRDKIVVTRCPRFRLGAATPAQRQRRDQFKAATVFAQRVRRSAAASAFYDAEAARLGRAGFRLAVSDHLQCRQGNHQNGKAAERLTHALRILEGNGGVIDRPISAAESALPIGQRGWLSRGPGRAAVLFVGKLNDALRRGKGRRLSSAGEGESGAGRRRRNYQRVAPRTRLVLATGPPGIPRQVPSVRTDRRFRVGSFDAGTV